MARIRTIKPEFWIDEKLGPLDPIHRLVFLGLISQADDDGRLVDNVRLLDGLIFPETEDSSRESLEVLARLSRIARYTSESGQRLIQIVNWEKHQRVDKPSKHTLPAPPSEVVPVKQDRESSGESRETLATPSRDALAPTLDHGPRTMDHGSGSGKNARAPEGAGDQPTNTETRGSHTPDRENEPDDLGEWLGDHASVTEGVPFLQSPRSRRSMFQQFGPPGLMVSAWKRTDGTVVPEPERPRLLAAALSAYSGEGKEKLVTNEFTGMLRRMIADPAGAGADHWAKALA